MMGILMHSAETDLIKGGGCPPSVWRMAVEGVRSRCVLALSPIESDYEVKSKHHREYEALQTEHERLTGRLQFWEGLREGSLPDHFCCLRTLDASGAIARAKEHHESLVAQRALALPEGMAPSMFVWRLAGLVRALVELQVAVAGRITQGEIPTAWALRPDVVALRSAVCFNGRDGAVQAGLVRRAVSLSNVYTESIRAAHGLQESPQSFVNPGERQ
jgi:hypothetical protein